MARQLAQTPHGRSPSERQLTALASILAVVVLPVPLVPQNKGMRGLLSLLLSGFENLDYVFLP